MGKFKTLEEAQKAYDELVKTNDKSTKEAIEVVLNSKNSEIEDLKKKSIQEIEAKDQEISTLKNSVKEITDSKISEIEDLKKQLADAEETARDAIEKVNNPEANLVKAKVGGKIYKVNFGVDGKSPEEIAVDQKLLQKLIDIGSGALSMVEQ